MYIDTQPSRHKEKQTLGQEMTEVHENRGSYEWRRMEMHVGELTIKYICIQTEKRAHKNTDRRKILQK